MTEMAYERDMTFNLPDHEYEYETRSIKPGPYDGEVYEFTSGITGNLGKLYAKAAGRIFLNGETRNIGTLTLWMPDEPREDDAEAMRFYKRDVANTQRFLKAMGFKNIGKLTLSEMNAATPIAVKFILDEDKKDNRYVRIVDIAPREVEAIKF